MRRLPRSAPAALVLSLFASLLAGTLGRVPGFAGEDAAPEAAPAGVRVFRHSIEARFEPSTHRIVARDRLDLDGDAPSLSFSLPLAIRVLGVRAENGADLPFVKRDAKDSMPGLQGYAVDLRAGPPGRRPSVEVRYAGEIFDGVQKRDDLSWVVGDSTSGLISEKGIYLTGGSGWYPLTSGHGLLRFDVTTYVPAPFVVVTQGGVPERSDVAFPKGWASDENVTPPGAEDGAPPEVAPGIEGDTAGTTYHKAVAHSVMPTDECSLSAGPYEVSTRVIEGIPVSTYFLPGEAPDAGLWLGAAEEILARYERMLGTYPHPKFDIVENFFSTGYGMPSYTLLGDDVIRYVTQGAKGSGGKIPPGYLDHEYVHGWFGNGLFVNPADGNWCEALTTYFSNYMAKELESPQAGLDARRGTLEHYAIRVPLAKDYPVRAFKGKTEDKDNDVGYGKGSLVFHMLRRRLGDVEFFARVKRFSLERAGSYVSWDDWLRLLDGAWAKPFIERKGLPAIRLVDASVWPAYRKSAPAEIDPTRWVVRAEAVVEAPRGEAPWPAIDLDVDVDGKKVGTLRFEGKSGVWRGVVEGAAPTSIELDARYEVLRRIADGDLPACLNRTLEAPGAVVVADAGIAPFQALVGRIAKEKGLAVLGPKDPVPTGKPVLSLHIPFPGEVLRWPAATATSIDVDGKSYEGPEYSILFSTSERGAPETHFVALSEKAAARAGTMTYYGWDGYVVFKAGQRTPVARGFLDRTPKGTRRAVTVGSERAALVDSIVTGLASDAFEGRKPGTKGHDDAMQHLRGGLLAADGYSPIEGLGQDGVFEFGLGVADRLSSYELLLTTDAGVETLPDAFRPLCASPEHAKGTPLPYAEGAGAVPAPGRLADPSPEGLARFWAQVESGAAPALLLSPSKEARVALAPFIDAPNALTTESAQALEAGGAGGRHARPASIGHWIGGRRSRALGTAGPLRVPVLVLSDAAIERLDRAPTVRAIDFEVRFGPEHTAWRAGKGGKSVVLARLPAALPKEKPPVVVLSAHYDSFGAQPDGAMFRGADDNASGVACVLAAARALAPDLDAADVKAGLIVCLFDGEEYGLVGSRALAPLLAERFHVLANVNVDSVGRVRDDTVFVVGLSKVPGLGAGAADALKAAGLAVGRDIDAYGYAHGSDHWSFHELGIPAITYWASDYGVMDTAGDVPEKVSPTGIVRLADAVRGLVRTLIR